MTTKERILDEALLLFSTNGFEAVSMRDIGAAVGIRESSIYKHYAGKQAILDSIVEKAMEEINTVLTELEVPKPASETSLADYKDMKFENIAALCSQVLLWQMKNPFIARFRQLLTIEQYRNEDLRKLYIENFMERQLRYNERVFSYLLDLGVIQGSSPQILALQFYAPFFLLQARLSGHTEELEATLQEHIIIFLNEHLKKEETV